MSETEIQFGVDPSLLAREVRHMELEDIAQVKEGGDEHIVQVMRDYLHRYCGRVYEKTEGERASNARQVCPACGEPFTGLMASMGIGVGIEWGIAHGEGHCSNCRWPYRGHHFIMDPKDLNEDGTKKPGAEPLMTIHNMFLAYHPENVDTRWKPPTKRNTDVGS